MRRPLLEAAIAMAALAVPVAWYLSRSAPPPTVHVEPRFETAPAVEPPPVQRLRATDGAVAEEVVLGEDTPAAPVKPPGRLVLRVLAAESDEPIAGARIVRLGEDEPTGPASGADGALTVEIPMDAGADAEDTWIDVVAPAHVIRSVRVTVASGAEERCEVRLRRGFAVDVFVHDAAGAPIAGCAISANAGYGFCGNSWSVVATASTGTDGRVRIDGIPQDDFVEFTFLHPRHAGRRVSRRPHNTRPLDVTLDAAGVLRGVVRDREGRPVAGARVEPCTSSDSGGGASPEAVRTDAEGRFEIGGLAFDRSWCVFASAAGWIDSEPSEEFTPTAEAQQGARDLVVRPPGRVEVELAFASPHAPCTATLRALGADHEACPVPGTTTIDVEGSTSVSVEADAAGFVRAAAAVEAKLGETQRVRLVLTEGVTVSGTVVDDLGAPVPGAEVWVDDQFHDAPDATADAKGAFAARGVSPGQHQLRARAAGVVTRGSQETVAPQDGVRLVLPRDGRVSLRLRLPDGAPRPATRRIHWNDYPNTADDDGPWTDGEIVTALPAGEYRLDIEVPGYVGVHRTNVAVSAGGRTDVGEIVLDPGLPLAGRVVDGAGNGVAFTAVFIDDEILRTDRDGRFRLEHAAAGPHEIRSSLSPDFLDEAMNVTLAADSAPVMVTLRRGAIVTVRLHGVPNEQRESYSVTASAAEAAEADELHWLQEAEEGSWVRLPAGSHRIEVRRDEVVVAVKTVALREGEDVTVEIDVAPK